MLRPAPSVENTQKSDTMKFIERFISEYSADRILDLGCGEGYLEAKYKDKITGVDIDKDRIARLKDQGISNIKHGSATDIPFDEGTHDMVIAKDLIEHLDIGDVLKMFEEAHRVLKKGGVFVVTTWRDCQIFWDKIDHIRPYSNKWVSTLCREGLSDFEVVFDKELSAGIPLFGLLRLEWLAHILADKLKFRVDHGIIVVKKK